MADSRRLSLGGRVATPRVSSVPGNSLLPIEATLARCIGARIRVTTVAPASQTYEQYIFALHPSSNLLILTPSSAQPTTQNPPMTIIPLRAVSSFTLLQLPSAPTTSPSSSSSANNKSTASSTASSLAAPLPPPIDPAAQQARLRATISRLQAEEAKRGKGVTREAQDIFDALARTLPTRWDGERIVVLDAVFIARPYRSEDCRAEKGIGAQMLSRVRMVLDSERKKLADKTKLGRSTPLGPQRKGG